ncbi:hypothetical protein DXT77_13180 [Pseudomonas sp. 91RF]|jgi:hypothetical protein|uniref:DUF6252 family protein n=1 Tax=Pseudomonas sp. 91RF TaxID=2292261 RepID=UPI000E6736B0|nr:DUF6252 family protein [Pseudomonas sp. 91RF]RIJ10714.1 hypothetical protein DXT77_13180 [Pseudomonas sp. 91RF]
MNGKMKDKAPNATGLFGLYANENDTGEELVPVKRMTLSLDTSSALIWGAQNNAWDSQGVIISIHGELMPNTSYPFKKDSAVADYIPKVWAGRSWDSVENSGQVKIDEVDHVKKTVKGTFEFAARSNDGSQTAQVRGSFNLRNN